MNKYYELLQLVVLIDNTPMNSCSFKEFCLSELHRLSIEKGDDHAFPIIALLDEKIKEKFGIDEMESLQELYYHTSNAGEMFYLKLNQLNNDEQQKLSIYFYCLLLGYRGQYYFHEESVIELIKHKVKKQLCDSTKKYHKNRRLIFLSIICFSLLFYITEGFIYFFA